MHLTAIQDHVRSVFFEGNAEYDIPALAAGVFETRSNLCMWYNNVCEQFPVASFLEDRVQTICAIMTQNLPEDSEVRINRAGILDIPKTDAIDASWDMNDVIGNGEISRLDKIVQLKEFIEETKQRRFEAIQTPASKV